jgi:Tol biopolymer transport system component
MTANDRFQDALPMTLIELADERMPDYVDDLIGQIAASRQRPAWTFPERWIPMADLVAERTFVPRFPWRALAVAALLLALIAGALWFAGSTRRLPAPFGPASNGLIAYASRGDIFTIDRASGVTRVAVGGPATDSDPIFSPDGQRLAFLRATGTTGAFDLLVARLDASEPVALAVPPVAADDVVQWSADSEALLLWRSGANRLLRLDATRPTAPTVIADNVVVERAAVRPPDGRQILFQYADRPGLYVMNADGSHPTLVAPEDTHDGHGYQFNHARWSPDGRWITFVRQRSENPPDQRVFIVRADGSNLHQAATEPGTVVEDDVAWAPDSTRFGMNRWVRNASGSGYDIQPIGVVTVATGAVVDVGPTPVADGALFEWSPDGLSILSLAGRHATLGSTAIDQPSVIDVATGTARDLGVPAEASVSWQRTAP